MKRLTLISLFLICSILFMAQVYAADTQTTINASNFVSNLPQIKAMANAKLSSTMGVAGFIGDNSVQIEINDSNGNPTMVYAVFKSGQIQTLEQGNIPNPGFTVYLSQDVINQIVSSPNPRTELKNDLNNKSVVINPNGFFNSIKYFFIKNILL